MKTAEEWWIEAKKYAQETTDKNEFERDDLYNNAISAATVDYDAGAQSYANAVEALLKKKIELAYVKSETEKDLAGSYLIEAHYFENLLTEIQTLTPVSND